MSLYVKDYNWKHLTQLLTDIAKVKPLLLHREHSPNWTVAAEHLSYYFWKHHTQTKMIPGNSATFIGKCDAIPANVCSSRVPLQSITQISGD